MANLIDILDQKGIEYEKTNNPMEIKIRCTSGNHSDNRPSLHYNLDKHVFNCFSCGFRGGIHKFLDSIGVSEKIETESKQEYRILKLKRKLQNIKNVDNLKLPHSYSRVSWDFKGINKATLQEFGAFNTTQYELEDYICFPIYQFKRLKFIEARKRNSTPGSKYTRKPAGAVTNNILFPVDKIDKVNRVVLVEGIFDMLNLWQHGVRNVLCIFGAQNFGREKVKLLDTINVHKIDIMMDGDESGRLAADKIYSLLDYNNIHATKIYLKEGEDPGSLNHEQIKYYLKDKHDQ